METWKDIEDYEGLYKISNYGRVMNNKHGKEKIMKLDYSTNKAKRQTPYISVQLWKNGKAKKKSVARLVVKHFLDVKGVEKYNITYADGDSTNLHYDNLIPMTKYSLKEKYGSLKDIEYKDKVFSGLKELANYYEISLTALYSRLRRNWTLKEAVETAVNGKLNNSGYFKYNEKFYTLEQLSKKSGIKKCTLKARIRHFGWSVEQAVDTPKLQH